MASDVQVEVPVKPGDMVVMNAVLDRVPLCGGFDGKFLDHVRYIDVSHVDTYLVLAVLKALNPDAKVVLIVGKEGMAWTREDFLTKK